MSRKTLFPPVFKAFFHKAAIRFAGLAVIAAGIAVAVALATYRIADPSFNTATGEAPVNALGYFGSYLSDTLWQYFGFGALLFPAALAAWGIIVVRLKWHKLQALRILCFVPTLLFVLILLSALPPADVWPVYAGAGGAVMPALYSSAIALLKKAYFPYPACVIQPVVFVAAVFGLAATLGIPFWLLKRWFAALKAGVKRLIALMRRRGKEQAETDEHDLPDEIPESLFTKQGDLDLGETPQPEKKTAPKPSPLRSIKEQRDYQKQDYHLPKLDLLAKPKADKEPVMSKDAMEARARQLETVLEEYGVKGKIVNVRPGPVVTLFELEPAPGIKTTRVINLADDIALALGASGVRIAPIPDKISVVGIEVPNKLVSAVHIRDVLESHEFTQHKSSVAFAVGKDIAGNNIIGNIAKLPHVLIAGTTGSGKSVCTNSLIVSLLYKSTPDEVRFIMVDPKMVELAPYNGIPHLLIPVVTDPKKAAGALQWAVYEMMKRYKLFSERNVKDLAGYNALAAADETLKKLPSVVVVIDELADLMLVAAKEVEESICRVAQMGRAAGMHLVIATQRPSADVITGLMKANIPSRIAFAVASSLESRIILDTTGAEKLVGRGDMLYAPLGEGKPRRVQGCFISAEEIDRVVGFVKANGAAQYDESVIDKIEQAVAEKEKGGKGAPSGAAPEPVADEGDELLPAAIDVVMETGQASVSMLQRRLKLGYSRAARIVDEMEQRGIVGPFEGSKPRQLLITREKWEEIKMRGGLGAMSSAAMAAQDAAAENPPVEEEIP